jgi:hypothetical protein
MRRLASMMMILLLAACDAHQPPDDGVSGRLREAVRATCIAMELPAEKRPEGRLLDDQVRLLAMRLTPQRVAEIDTGRLDRVVVAEAFGNALKRRTAKGSTSLPPRLLVFLVERQPTWSVDQVLLASALLAQYEHEALLVPPTRGLGQ